MEREGKIEREGERKRERGEIERERERERRKQWWNGVQVKSRLHRYLLYKHDKFIQMTYVHIVKE